MAGRILAEDGSSSHDSAWNKSIRQFRRDRKAMQNLVADTKSDLFARLPELGSARPRLRELAQSSPT